MKVVINQDYGGFVLSNEAVERCVELGMKLTKYSRNAKAYEDPTADFVKVRGKSIGNIKYYTVADYDDIDNKEKSFRCNPILIKVVEELGEKANGFCAELGIIEIPFDSVQGWKISEYINNLMI